MYFQTQSWNTVELSRIAAWCLLACSSLSLTISLNWSSADGVVLIDGVLVFSLRGAVLIRVQYTTWVHVLRERANLDTAFMPDTRVTNRISILVGKMFPIFGASLPPYSLRNDMEFCSKFGRLCLLYYFITVSRLPPSFPALAAEPQWYIYGS